MSANQQSFACGCDTEIMSGMASLPEVEEHEEVAQIIQKFYQYTQDCINMV